MKIISKPLRILLVLSLQLLTTVLLAQSPQVINYQGIARDAAGQPIKNTSIGIKFELRQGSATSPTVFVEIQTRTTNDFGLFTTQIGNATTNGLAQINWTAGSVFLQIGIDAAGGTNYVSLGNPQQLVSVPYAMHAESVPATYSNNILTVGKQSFTLASGGGGSSPNTTITSSGGGASVSSSGTNTFNIDVPVTSISGGTNVNVQGTHPNYTISSTPSLSINGNNLSISGGNIVTIPTSGTIAAVTTSIVSSGAATTSVLGPNSFSIDVPVPVFSNATQSIITGSYPNFIVNTPTVPAGSNATVVASGAAVNTTLAPNSYSIYVPPTNVVVTSSATTLSVTNVGTNSVSINVPTVAITNGTNVSVTGSYPNYVVSAMPTLTILPGNLLQISGGNSVLLPISSGTLVAQTTTLQTGGIAALTTFGANDYSINVAPPVFSPSGPVTITGTYPNLTITSPAATPNTTITPGGIASVSNPATNSFVVSVPSPTFTPSGPTTISGTYPNLTITSPTVPAATPNTTITPGGIASVSNPVTNSFVVSVPSPTFTPSGPTTISGTYPNLTITSPTVPAATPNTTITQGGIAAVSNPATNSFVVSVPSPTFTPSGPTTISGTYPNLTITSPTVPAATPNTTITPGGIAAVSNPVTNSFVVSVPSPTFTPSGPTTISGTYPNLTITSPTIATTPTVSAAGIATVSAGPNYVVGVQSPTFTNSGPTTISGTYPNLTITSPTVPAATPNTTITPGGIAAVSNPVTNSFVVSVPSPTFTPSGPTTISGTYPNLTITSPTVPAATPNTTITPGGIAAVTNPVTNSFVVSVPSPTFTPSGPTTISGTYPNLTITSPTIATTPTVSAAGIATVSAGPNYVVGVQTPVFTNATQNIITGTYPNYSVNTPTIANTSIALTATAAAGPSLTSSGTNSFNINIPPASQPTFAYSQTTGSLTSGTSSAYITPNLTFSNGVITSGPATNSIAINSGTNAAWSTIGNVGTSSVTNFIGTTDAMALVFKVNNQKAGLIDHIIQNTFFGYQSGNVNTGANNTGFGYQALALNSSGILNTAVGHLAMSNNATGSRNTVLGRQALNANTGGSDNAVVGYRALLSSTGSSNVAIGSEAGFSSTGSNGNVFLGNNAGYYETTSNKLYISNSSTSVTPLIYGDFTNGYLGVGTATSNAPLQFANSNLNKKIVLFDVAGVNQHQFAGFGFDGNMRYQTGGSATDHVFWSAANAVSSNELMRITGTGKVGIGISTPSANLHVSNSSASGETGYFEMNNIAGTGHALIVNSNSNSQYALRVFNTSTVLSAYGQITEGGLIVRGKSTSTLSYAFKAQSSGGADRVVIQDNGNVGIGTSNPSALLDFGNLGGTNKIISIFGSTPGDDHQYYGIGISPSTLRFHIDGTPQQFAFFAGTSSVTSNELMRINGNGNVGIGTSVVGSNRLNVMVPSTDGVTPIGLVVTNNYTGTATKYGIDVNVDGAGSGSKYGISSTVIGLALDASAIYGYQLAMTPNGTGTGFGVISQISGVGTGQRYGNYTSVLSNAANTSNTYGNYILMSGTNATAIKNGIYITGEDQNYFSGDVGIGTTAPSEKLDVVGNIEIPAANNYRYATAKTNYATVSAASFASINGLQTDGTGTGNARWISSGTVGLADNLYGTIQLPNGATITAIDAYVTDNDGLRAITVDLVRLNMVSNTIATIGTTGTSGVAFSGGATTISDTGLSTVVDNSSSSYFIKVNTFQNNSNLWIRGARITYIVDKTD